jgi:hypothetical protein
MSQPTDSPTWAKLFRVTEVSRWDTSSDSNRAWYRYVLESDYTKMVGKRFGTSTEIWGHAKARAAKLNERLLGPGNRSIKLQERKKK